MKSALRCRCSDIAARSASAARLAVFALFASITLPDRALAQSTPPPASTEMDQRLELARKVMEVTGAVNVADQMIAGIEQQLIQLLSGTNPGKEREVRSLVSDVLLPEFRARIGEIQEPSARMWAQTYSVDELNELLRFYETPTGQKMIATMPQLMQQSQALGMAWGQRVAQDAIAKHQRTIRERGIRI